MLRTHTCGELTLANVGQNVELAGWVNARRDFGKLVFIDLRDRYGLTQLHFDLDQYPQLAEAVGQLKNEWVIFVKGQVVARPKEMVNAKISSGEIELAVNLLEVLSAAKTLPFEINNENQAQANENLRLQYRFLDLRRPKLQTMLATKDRFITFLREYFHKKGFIEVQTPILANSSPEGARDFLIPARLHPGKFYALPQAPQQFKQLLMVGGLDRYFQIAPCFRDEDTRLDRHYGEFYQLDMEMSFANQDDVLAMMEPLMREAVKKFSTKKLIKLNKDKSFLRLPWREALTRYGSDKPDLRYGLEITPITEIVGNIGFNVFDQTIAANNVIHALKVENTAGYSRSQIDNLEALVKQKGAKGLVYILLEKGDTSSAVKSPLTKFVNEKNLNKIIKAVKAKPRDGIFIVAGPWKIVCDSLGALRLELAKQLNLVDNGLAAFCWIVDFPVFELNDQGKVDFGHNPFSMPQGGLEALQATEPLDLLAYQYDLVFNGLEVSSGAVRNNQPEIMYEVFQIVGYSREQVDQKFGAMIRAFEFGAPPHAGNAPGIDRLLMAFNDWDSIRDVYAFPKDGQGRDLMMDSPSEVDESQLTELGIKILPKVS